MRTSMPVTLKADGYVSMTIIGIHHVGNRCTILALAVYHDTEQLAAALVLVVVEHLQAMVLSFLVILFSLKSCNVNSLTLPVACRTRP